MLNKKDTAPIEAALPILPGRNKQSNTSNLISNLIIGCWLMLFCAITFNTRAQCHIDDFNALKTFYESTDGNAWNNSSFWDMVSEEEEPLSDCNLSFLLGVSLNGNGRVKSLELFNNALSGTLPEEIGLLSELTSLSLNDNQLEGVLPETIVSLSQLSNLSLSNNNFSGALPDNFEMLTQLTTIFLDNNQISGELPDFTLFRDLELLFIERNQFNGSIPQGLDQLTNLQYLVAYNNQLEGSLPDGLDNLVNLKWLLLHQNKLSGCFTESLCIVELDSLNLTENPGLPNAGDTLAFAKFCMDTSSQLNLPCNDGDEETINDKIQEDCNCKGELMINVDGVELDESVVIYPNPSTSYIHINGQLSLQLNDYQLLDGQGKIVLHGSIVQSSKIFVQQLSEGIYYLRFLLKEEQVLIPFIKI